MAEKGKFKLSEAMNSGSKFITLKEIRNAREISERTLLRRESCRKGIGRALAAARDYDCEKPIRYFRRKLLAAGFDDIDD